MCKEVSKRIEAPQSRGMREDRVRFTEKLISRGEGKREREKKKERTNTRERERDEENETMRPASERERREGSPWRVTESVMPSGIHLLPRVTLLVGARGHARVRTRLGLQQDWSRVHVRPSQLREINGRMGNVAGFLDHHDNVRQVQ